jgi:hypothetical protein
MSLLRRLEKKLLLFWAAEFSLAICLFYAFFYLASSLGVHFFVLSNRAMVEQTAGGSVLSGSLDVVVWGFAVFVVLVWVGYYLGLSKVRFYSRLFLGIVFMVFLAGLAVGVCLVVLGLVGVWFLVLVSGLLLGFCFLFSSVFFGVGRLVLFLRVLFGGLLLVFFVELVCFVLFSVPVALGLPAGVLGLHWGGVELVFSNVFDFFLVYVYLFFVLLGVVVFVFRVFPGLWGWLVVRFRVRFGRVVSWLRGLFLFVEVDLGFLGVRWVVLAVVVSCFVSCLFVLFTVLPWNNPTGMLVSADAPVYYQWIHHMRSVDVNSALSFALSNDRALFLVLSYVFSFFVTPLNVVQFAGALLIMIFGVVSLFILRMVISFRAVWVFGVLLLPFSFQSLGLIYSGYFANMLALILLFVYVFLFFKVLDHFSGLGVFGLLGISELVFFSHSWTWFFFAFTLCMFLLLQWRLASHDKSFWRRFKNQAILIGATILVGFLSDIVRRFLSSGSSSASVLATAQSSLNFPNAVYLLNGLRESVNFVLGGVFANQLLIFLSVVGFLVLVRIKSEVSNFFVAWVFVGCVSILFATKDLVFDRFLFLMPWVVLSSLGLFFVVGLVRSQTRRWKSWKLCVLILILSSIFLVLLNESLRFIFNINIW